VKRIGRVMVAAGLSVGLALGVTACGGGASVKAGAAAGASGASSSGGHTIVIKNFDFMPMSLTVKAGATVSVHNEDSTTHTLTASNGAFTTGNIAPGATKTFTAPSQPGQYSFVCQIHQYMTGDLTVTS